MSGEKIMVMEIVSSRFIAYIVYWRWDIYYESNCHLEIVLVRTNISSIYLSRILQSKNHHSTSSLCLFSGSLSSNTSQTFGAPSRSQWQPRPTVGMRPRIEISKPAKDGSSREGNRILDLGNVSNSSSDDILRFLIYILPQLGFSPMVFISDRTALRHSWTNYDDFCIVIWINDIIISFKFSFIKVPTAMVHLDWNLISEFALISRILAKRGPWLLEIIN